MRLLLNNIDNGICHCGLDPQSSAICYHWIPGQARDDRLRHTRGSAMVSSAIYFPIIILATLFAIHIMLNQYEEVKQTSAMHMELRVQASIKTGTGVSIENKAGNDRDIQAYKAAEKEVASFGEIYGDKYIKFKGKRKYDGGRLTAYSTETADYTARSYLIDEQSEVRNPLR